MALDFSTDEKIEGVLDWAGSDAPDSFDSTFIENLRDHFENHGNLSIGQVEALDNIIEKFGIDLQDYI